MQLEIRPITPDEVDAFRIAMSRGFGGDPHPDDTDRFHDLFELDRTVAAFDGPELVGTGGAFTFQLTVPGGTVPMGGTTVIAVQPTHRRRGVLTAMMRAHLDEVRGRGEVVAGLWASEATIYGRFGYGIATEMDEVRIDGRTMHFRGAEPPGRLRQVEPDDAAALLPAIYDRGRLARPGMLDRRPAWWAERVLPDPEHRRGGQSAKRFVVHEGPDGPDGYAIYRQKDKREGGFLVGTVTVLEVAAPTPPAHEALWRYLTHIDLYPHVHAWNTAVDDELPWRVTDPRRVVRERSDAMWIRPMDVAGALAGRTYQGSGRLVIEVTDPFRNDGGRFELDVDDGAATCRPTTRTADLELGSEALGSMYLGGLPASTLARGGLVRGDARSVRRADRLFASDRAPWCPFVF